MNLLKVRVATRSLRLERVPVQYACREANGSLRPVPPGRSRAEMYCPHCVAPRCLFAPSPYYDEQEPKLDLDLDQGEKDLAKVAAGRSKARANRAAGLSPTGEPLQESCWNCASLRMDGEGKYICPYRPEEKPRGRWTMENSRPRTPCDLFETRLVMEIPPLDDILGGGE